MNRRGLIRIAAFGGAGLLGSRVALAQTGPWPNRPIRFVVPGPAGAGMDIFARLISEPLGAALKQPVIIDNKPGANSLIGNDAVAKSAPDGYTMLMTPSSAIALNPIVVPKMPYDTEKDLLPVAQIGAAGFLLVANPGSGMRTLADLVKHAKANPGKLTYGTWGNGSSGHLAMEGLKAHYGLDMTHVPYKGTAALVQDLIGGNLLVGFADIASPVPHIKAGRLNALGATGSKRGPALPEVPTVAEQGYKFDADGWYGIFVPTGTPAAVVNRLNEEINRILASEPVRQKFAAQNMTAPWDKSAAQFAATVKSDIALWQSMARTANLKID